MNRPTDSKMRSVDERLSQNVLLNTECVINKNTDEELVCWGYTYSAWRKALFWVAVVLTLGLLLLIVNWKPELECYLQYQRCALYKAHFILIRTRYGVMSVIQVQTITEPVEGVVNYRIVQVQSEHLSSNYTSGSLTSSSVSGAGSGAAIVPDNVGTTDDTAQLTSAWQEEEEDGDLAVGGSDGFGAGGGAARYFDFQKTRYVWDQARRTFRKLEDLSTGTTCLTIHEQFQGMSDEQRMARLRLYGFNSMEIDVPSYWNLFIKEVLNPFYIFQIASIILWSLDNYYYYAACIFLISAISITISLRETKRQRVTLRDMVSTEGNVIKVCTETGSYIEKPEHDLVPGDLIAIPPNGCIMTCDAVLTAGTCIVNESMLTGESVPVTKTPLLQSEDNEIYAPEQHKRHTLFSGTHIVQTRYYGQAKVTAVVVRTGFNTAKGELVRAILFPKPLDIKFYQDAIKFILFLSVVASFGMTYSTINYIINNEPAEKIILRVLDIVTVVVPPALPAAMTVGTVYAQNRLKKSKIFCISPPRINFCGRINVFCFDKTGTLTEDGLDMWGVVPVEMAKFKHHIPDPSTLQRGPLIVCLATCHSLTIIDGELSGDPLDLIMFNAIKWYLEEPGADTHKYDTIMPTVVKPYSAETFLGEEDEFEYLQHEVSTGTAPRGQPTPPALSVQEESSGYDIITSDQHPFEVGIIRQFTFSSSAQRMSVITRTMGEDHMDIHCKGAPEKVASLCRPETVPQDFHSVLHSYSIQGFRVIALAHRPMDPKITWHQVQRISRDKIEKDLTFLGLLVLQNQLKPQTAPVIRTLKSANIRSVMITGDMLQTAVSVARNCAMVGQKERVILVHAHPPDVNKGQHSASIDWEEAEHGVTEDEGSNSTTEVDTDPENQPLLTEENGLDVSGPQNQRYTKVTMDAEIPHKKHLAVNGRSYQVICNHFPDLLPKLCVQGTIFARMSPEQKCHLIEQLQHLDYTVGMCGDGANDCEALKAAHAGISLSEAEASVAAPFTSSVNNIECVITAIRYAAGMKIFCGSAEILGFNLVSYDYIFTLIEGRAALVTSFGCFKYMALYSFIQFVSVLILYTYLTNLSDFEYLHIDLVITTSIAVLMGNTAAYDFLVRKKPPGSLVKSANLVSILSQVFLVAAFQVGGFFYLRSQGFYVPAGSLHNTTDHNSSGPANESDAAESRTWESSIIFLLSSFMYISVAFTFSTGPPFRKPIYTNVLYTLTLILLFAFSTFLLLSPVHVLISLLDMMPLQQTPFKFRLVLLGMAVAFVILSCIVEWLVMESGWLKCLYQHLDRLKKVEKSKYKTVLREIMAEDWPPVAHEAIASNATDSGSGAAVEAVVPTEVLINIH